LPKCQNMEGMVIMSGAGSTAPVIPSKGGRMENPCMLCNHPWSAGRNTSCADCCDKLRMYKEVIEMQLKPCLTEQEYDRLSEGLQYNYIWCEKCQLYYTKAAYKQHVEPINHSQFIIRLNKRKVMCSLKCNQCPIYVKCLSRMKIRKKVK
jgi:hypothetical protein